MGLCNTKDDDAGPESMAGVSEKEGLHRTTASSDISKCNNAPLLNSSSPSSVKTQPETPSPHHVAPRALNHTRHHKKRRKKPTSSKEMEQRNDIESAMEMCIPSLRFTEELQPTILEEVEADAPSDEEDYYVEHLKSSLPITPIRKKSTDSTVEEVNKENNRIFGRLTKSNDGSSLSPPRSMSTIKLRTRKRNFANPSSIIYHPPQLVDITSSDNNINNNSTANTADDYNFLSPSKSSVHTHTIRQFSKLKLQVKLAAKQERSRRRRLKLEERFGDVLKQRRIWKEFEEIECKINNAAVVNCQKEKEAIQENDENNKSLTLEKEDHTFTLKRPTSWYFDFRTLYDDDSNSQSSLSLLGSSSMEFQKNFFAEKKKKRSVALHGRVSGSNKNDKKVDDDDRSMSSLTSTESMKGDYMYRENIVIE